MVKLRIKRRVTPPEERLAGLAWVEGRLWLASGTSNKLYDGGSAAKSLARTPSSLESPTRAMGGMAWDGKHVWVADRGTKVLYRVHPKSGKATKGFDLTTLKVGDSPEVFRATNSEVTDIAWGDGMLWVACSAGYSSLIYCIDIGARRVAQHIPASGPKPTGVAFGARQKRLWTLDGSNRELCEFTPEGEWTGEKLAVPVKRPTGLELDGEDAFWTADEKTNRVIQLKREG